MDLDDAAREQRKAELLAELAELEPKVDNRSIDARVASLNQHALDGIALGIEDEDVALICAPDDLGFAREVGEELGIGRVANLRPPSER